MSELRTHARSSANRETVWAVLVDHAAASRWMSGLLRSRLVTPDNPLVRNFRGVVALREDDRGGTDIDWVFTFSPRLAWTRAVVERIVKLNTGRFASDLARAAEESVRWRGACGGGERAVAVTCGGGERAVAGSVRWRGVDFTHRPRRSRYWSYIEHALQAERLVVRTGVGGRARGWGAGGVVGSISWFSTVLRGMVVDETLRCGTLRQESEHTFGSSSTAQ